MLGAERACTEILDRAAAAYYALSLEEQGAADLRALEFLATHEFEPFDGPKFATYRSLKETR